MQEFIRGGGDKRWLQGLDFAPKKLRDLNEVNKVLAHQPWRMTAGHIQHLTRGLDENWSISEVVHAIVILTHFHAMCSLIFSSGISDDDDQQQVQSSAAIVVAADDEQDDENDVENDNSILTSPTVMTQPAVMSRGSSGRKTVAAATPVAGESEVTMVKAIVCPSGPGRTGQDSPPLNSHLVPGSPPSQASVEVCVFLVLCLPSSYS